MTAYILDLFKPLASAFTAPAKPNPAYDPDNYDWSIGDPFAEQVQFIRLNPSVPTPRFATPGSAGVDLIANVRMETILPARASTLIPTGLKLKMPSNLVGKIYPRSGKSTKEGLVLANTVGIIDSDYRGEVMIAAYNRNHTNPVVIKPGERIAQILFSQVVQPDLLEVAEFDDVTERGEGGFGSTGAA